MDHRTTSFGHMGNYLPIGGGEVQLVAPLVGTINDIEELTGTIEDVTPI